VQYKNLYPKKSIVSIQKFSSFSFVEKRFQSFQRSKNVQVKAQKSYYSNNFSKKKAIS
jgi:hypothetical protein